MTIWLVRHGHAGDRHHWDGDQDGRPLSRRGQRQAEGLVEALGGRTIERILSSRTARCTETVAPLAADRHLEVEVSAHLYEGNRADHVIGFVDGLWGTHAVLCSHGDVIPDLLWLLHGRGLHLPTPTLCEKGSVWELDRTDDGFSADYLSPVV